MNKLLLKLKSDLKKADEVIQETDKIVSYNGGDSLKTNSNVAKEEVKEKSKERGITTDR